nr:hypothetical protein GCM10020092_096990 [Actinoplanes digitatis]
MEDPPVTIYSPPGSDGAIVSYESRYDHWIGGEYVPPAEGRYFENPSPVNGQNFCEIARGTAADVERALDAAHAAADAWGRTSVAERANILNKIADRMEANLEKLAVAETWENGKPVRETMAADLPLAIDHFRYFAGALRAQEGTLGEIDDDTIAYHFHEPLGVVAQIIPWNFPILMAVWKLAPALAAGNAVVLKLGRADPGVDPPVDVARRRPAAAGRRQHRERLRRRGRQAAGVLEAGRQGGVHRRDHHRPSDHAVRLREHHPGDAGARRQEPEHLLRRRQRRRRRLHGQGARGLHDVRPEPG